MNEKTDLLIDGSWGIYIPQRFAGAISAGWEGIDDQERAILSEGPTERNDTLYWETWDDVVANATFTDSEGEVWRLWYDNDLFMYTGEGEQWT